MSGFGSPGLYKKRGAVENNGDEKHRQAPNTDQAFSTPTSLNTDMKFHAPCGASDDSFVTLPGKCVRLDVPTIRSNLRDSTRKTSGVFKPILPIPPAVKFVRRPQPAANVTRPHYGIWETPCNFHATESLVHSGRTRRRPTPPSDPKCISCHVTGWNPQTTIPTF